MKAPPLKALPLYLSKDDGLDDLLDKLEELEAKQPKETPPGLIRVACGIHKGSNCPRCDGSGYRMVEAKPHVTRTAHTREVGFPTKSLAGVLR
jgi:hypothetical protein